MQLLNLYKKTKALLVPYIYRKIVSPLINSLHEISTKKHTKKFSLTQTNDWPDHYLKLFDGFNDEAPSIDQLKGNKNHLTPFLISSFGNSLFLKFEGNQIPTGAAANPGGFFATIHYGNTPDSMHIL